MFKMVMMAKRKPGLSMEEFIDYYETKHVPLATGLVPNLKRYVRNYLTPVGTKPDAELEFDVISEFIFDDREDFERGTAHMGAPENAAKIANDEEKFLDRSRTRVALVEERGSA